MNTKSSATAQESDSPTAAGPRRLTAAERKTQLVDVAIAMFGQRGYRGATTKAIAEAAGVSEATIFRHFPSKDDLYIAAFRQRTWVGTEQLVACLQNLADRGRDEELLHTLAIAILTGYKQDRDLHRMLLYAWLDQDEVANRRMWSQMHESPLFEFLERYIARRQAAGVFGAGDPALLCQMVVALPVSYATGTKLYGIEPATPDEEIAALHARFLLAGLRETGAAPPS